MIAEFLGFPGKQNLVPHVRANSTHGSIIIEMNLHLKKKQPRSRLFKFMNYFHLR